jgi:circadian clock protein KaiC
MNASGRVPTGIGELDRILGGGLLRGSSTLVAGGPGTGKTVLGAQFIFNGALRFSENGVYVTFNEDPTVLKRQMLALGWDFERLENEGKVRILDFVPMVKDNANLSFDVIYEEARTLHAKRLVIDSSSALILAHRETKEVRPMLSVIQKLFRRLDCTSLLISEVPWGNKGLSSGIEEFVADGIIMLETLPVGGELKRRLAVLKMRGTNHDMKFYQYAIAKENGIVISPYPEVD